MGNEYKPITRLSIFIDNVSYHYEHESKFDSNWVTNLWCEYNDSEKSRDVFIERDIMPILKDFIKTEYDTNIFRDIANDLINLYECILNLGSFDYRMTGETCIKIMKGKRLH